MKKIIIFLLVLSLVISIPAGVTAAEPKVAKSVTISADGGFTAKTTSSVKSSVDGFVKLIDSSKSASVKKENLTELARISIDFGGSAETRVVYKDASGILYVNSGNKYRKIDADSFYKLADSTGTGFYKLRGIPVAKVGSKNLGKVKSDYAFKKLDGKFYKSQYKAGTDPIPRVSPENGRLPVPTFSVKPSDVSVTVTASGSQSIEWSGKLSEMSSFKPEKDGEYFVRFRAAYNNPHTTGEVVYEYSITYSSGIDFTMAGANTYPGETVVIRAKNIPEGEKITVTSKLPFKPEFFRERGGDMVALMAVSYNVTPGTYALTLSCAGVSKTLGIAVNAKTFPVQQLTVPPATAQETILNQQADDEYEKYIAPVRKISDNKQHWDGSFIWPLNGNPRVTTQFGVIRYVNGSKTPSRHGAIDFAAAAGTPVYASNGGRVLYSGFLKLTGHTIVIEHGYGLKTWHYHMNGRNVKTGDMVKKNQQIGIVGSTGFSTGAHLHFGMSVSNAGSSNTFINPSTVIQSNLIENLARDASYEPLG